MSYFDKSSLITGIRKLDEEKITHRCRKEYRNNKLVFDITLKKTECLLGKSCFATDLNIAKKYDLPYFEVVIKENPLLKFRGFHERKEESIKRILGTMVIFKENYKNNIFHLRKGGIK